MPKADLEAGVGVLTAFVQAGLAASNGDARRSAQGGGLKVNDRTVTDPKEVLSLQSLNDDGVIKLSLGKKKHILLKPV